MTKAQQLEITEFPYIEKDNNGNLIYWEDKYQNWFEIKYNYFNSPILKIYSTGIWEKWEYNDNGKQTYYEHSKGGWKKEEYDNSGNRIYYETSKAGWIKFKYDSLNRRIFEEYSDGSWVKSTFNNEGDEETTTYSNGLVEFRIYNDKGNIIYYKNREGEIFIEKYDPIKKKHYFHTNSTNPIDYLAISRKAIASYEKYC